MDNVINLIKRFRAKAEQKFQEAERLTIIANTLRDAAYDLENAVEKDVEVNNKLSSLAPTEKRSKQ